MMVNGNEERLPGVGMTLDAFLKHKGLQAGSVVVERNGDVVERSRFDVVALEEADRLEILRFVGGGA